MAVMVSGTDAGNVGRVINALLLDLGGTAHRSALEIMGDIALRRPELRELLAERGPVGERYDEPWHRMQRQEIGEREYWQRRAVEIGAGLGQGAGSGRRPMTGWAVVVGATGALGGAICARLRKADLRVVGVARDAAALDALDGVVPCPADIGDDASVARIREAVGGPVRIVVQAAGLPASGPVDAVEPAALGAAVALKAGGLLRLVRAVDSRLRPGSRIVALGGHYGSEPVPHACAAGLTNAALANLVRQLADHYGPRGITVHLLAPGAVDTERLHRIAATAAARRGVPVAEVFAGYRAASPLGRLVTAEQVAWATALLLDPEADALHGATLALDGGSRKGIF